MPSLDFNRLSPETRRRLSDPSAPLVSFELPQPVFRWWAAIALGLGLCVAAWNATHAVSWKALALWGAAAFGLTAGLAGLLRGVLVRRQASPRNGVHVFALDLVVVEGARLTIYPMHEVRMRTSVWQTRYYGSHTSLHFDVPGRSITFHGGSEVTRQRILAAVAQGREAALRRDLATVAALDPFFLERASGRWQDGRPGDGPIRRGPPLIVRMPLAIGAAAALLLAFPVTDAVAYAGFTARGGARHRCDPFLAAPGLHEEAARALCAELGHGVCAEEGRSCAVAADCCDGMECRMGGCFPAFGLGADWPIALLPGAAVVEAPADAPGWDGRTRSFVRARSDADLEAVTEHYVGEAARAGFALREAPEDPHYLTRVFQRGASTLTLTVRRDPPPREPREHTLTLERPADGR